MPYGHGVAADDTVTRMVIDFPHDWGSIHSTLWGLDHPSNRFHICRTPAVPRDKWQKWVTNVSKPTLTIYRPDADKDNGAAVLICPGGGYHALKSHLHRKEFP